MFSDRNSPTEIVFAASLTSCSFGAEHDIGAGRTVRTEWKNDRHSSILFLCFFVSAAGTSSDNPSASESCPILGIGPALPVCSLLSLALITYICTLAFFPEALPERLPVNTVRVAVSQNGKPDDKTGAVPVPLTADSRIKAYNAWGDEAVNRLNSLLPKAAEMAAATPECDSVEWAELSDFRSRPPEKAVFFVKCRNGRAVFVPEEDLTVAFDR